MAKLTRFVVTYTVIRGNFARFLNISQFIIEMAVFLEIFKLHRDITLFLNNPVQLLGYKIIQLVID